MRDGYPATNCFPSFALTRTAVDWPCPSLCPRRRRRQRRSPSQCSATAVVCPQASCVRRRRHRMNPSPAVQQSYQVRKPLAVRCHRVSIRCRRHDGAHKRRARHHDTNTDQQRPVAVAAVSSPTGGAQAASHLPAHSSAISSGRRRPPRL
jgi:hypothetical protein